MELNREEMEEVFGWLCEGIDSENYLYVCSPEAGNCKDWQGKSLYRPKSVTCCLCQRLRQELEQEEETNND